MRDGLDQLLRDERLYQLLAHYQAAAGDDREAWSDRVAEWQGDRPEELTRWHGGLLAAAWIEQNTGHTPPTSNGGIAQCYRLTPAGRKAVKRAQEQLDEDDASIAA